MQSSKIFKFPLDRFDGLAQRSMHKHTYTNIHPMFCRAWIFVFYARDQHIECEEATTCRYRLTVIQREREAWENVYTFKEVTAKFFTPTREKSHRKNLHKIIWKMREITMTHTKCRTSGERKICYENDAEWKAVDFSMWGLVRVFYFQYKIYLQKNKFDARTL